MILVHFYILQETYVGDADPWMGILAATDFTVQSMYHQTLKKMFGQLVFGGNMILPINHIANWIYILERNQIEIEKHAI